jgi:hypothetical protein
MGAICWFPLPVASSNKNGYRSDAFEVLASRTIVVRLLLLLLLLLLVLLLSIQHRLLLV